MSRHRIWRVGVICVVAAAVLSSGAASASTNVLVNGSFEWPRLGNGVGGRAFAPGAHVGAWTVTRGGVSVNAAIAPFEVPPVGRQLLGLAPAGATGDGEVCQTASAMVPGAVYKIRLLAASPIAGSTIDATLDGVVVAHLELPADHNIPTQFKQFVWHVVADASFPTFCLRGHRLGLPALPLVDAVRIKPVPASESAKVATRADGAPISCARDRPGSSRTTTAGPAGEPVPPATTRSAPRS